MDVSGTLQAQVTPVGKGKVHVYTGHPRDSFKLVPAPLCWGLCFPKEGWLHLRQETPKGTGFALRIPCCRSPSDTNTCLLSYMET